VLWRRGKMSKGTATGGMLELSIGAWLFISLGRIGMDGDLGEGSYPTPNLGPDAMKVGWIPRSGPAKGLGFILPLPSPTTDFASPCTPTRV
jgi:hypothetical protein